MSNIIKTAAALATLFVAFACGPVMADSAQYRADAAVADVLFDFDGAEQFASYAVRSDGFVDITFARNTPSALYGEILQRLQDHEDIDGVLAGKSGPACSLF